MFCLLQRSKYLSLSIDLQKDLFNKIVKPILLYGCECWGFSNQVFFKLFLMLNHVLRNACYTEKLA